MFLFSYFEMKYIKRLQPTHCICLSGSLQTLILKYSFLAVVYQFEMKAAPFACLRGM